MSDLPPTDDSAAREAEGGVLEGEAPCEETGRSAIQVDAYGIKARIQPVAHGEPAPKTWKEVWEAVDGKLKSIAVNFVGLIDDGFEGARRIVRGISEIPGALARRIDRAHERADRAEAIKQEKTETGALPPPAPEEAVDRLESFLAALQADGAAVEMRELEGGGHAIVIAKPEDRALAAELACKALPAPSRRPTSRAGGGGTESAASNPVEDKPKRQRKPRQKPKPD